ncbi:MAG: PAS domain S-box protein, partial [Magnetospirillum sp.]
MSRRIMAADSILQSLTDASEMGMVLIDSAGRVGLWNAWMTRASGIDATWAMGCGLVEIFPDLAGTRILQSVDQALNAGLSAMLSSSLNKKLFPLLREGRTPDHPEPMHQIVVVKPLEIGRA